jgi:hypothetical protein
VNDAQLRDLTTQLNVLGDKAVGYLLATVTDLEPLTIAPHGSGEVPAVAIGGANVAVDDVVACLDPGPGYPPLVLGTVGTRSQTDTIVVTGDGTAVKSTVVPHDLGVAPSVVHAIASDGTYNVATGSYDADDFTLIVRNVDAATWSGDVTVRWEAKP